MNKPVVLFVDDDRYEMLGLTERLEASGFMVEPMFSSSFLTSSWRPHPTRRQMPTDMSA